MIRSALTLFCILSLSFIATAQEDRIEGQWSLKAWTGDGCSFTGNATLGLPVTPGGPYVCELVTKQTCGNGGGEWIVRQTCTATRTGDRLAIKSQITEFISEPSATYLPDDFLLTVDISKRMFGALHSYGVYKSVWVREIGDIS